MIFNEFAKSRHMRASVVYVPRVCQLLIFTCQRAKGMPIFQLGGQTCQKRSIFFSSLPAKRCANSPTIFQKIIFFIYLTYLYLIYFVYFKYIPNHSHKEWK